MPLISPSEGLPEAPGTAWNAQPPGPALPPNEVHVWRARLDRTDRETAAFSSLLSAPERARRDRFAFEPDRNRFAVARSLLRLILSRYLGADPGGIALNEGENGKPGLPGGELEFNVSHTRGLALFALAQHRRVGVDVETVRTVSESRSIAARWFGPGERGILEAASDDEWPRAFLECWTSKEAHVKAVGTGLGTPLARIDIWRGVENRSYRIGDGETWTLRPIAAGDGLVASLVVEGDDDWTLSTFEAGSTIEPRGVV